MLPCGLPRLPRNPEFTCGGRRQWAREAQSRSSGAARLGRRVLALGTDPGGLPDSQGAGTTSSLREWPPALQRTGGWSGLADPGQGVLEHGRAEAPLWSCPSTTAKRQTDAPRMHSRAQVTASTQQRSRGPRLASAHADADSAHHLGACAARSRPAHTSTCSHSSCAAPSRQSLIFKKRLTMYYS